MKVELEISKGIILSIIFDEALTFLVQADLDLLFKVIQKLKAARNEQNIEKKENLVDQANYSLVQAKRDVANAWKLLNAINDKDPLFLLMDNWKRHDR